MPGGPSQRQRPGAHGQVGGGERLQGAGLPPQAPGFLPTLRFP